MKQSVSRIQNQADRNLTCFICFLSIMMMFTIMAGTKVKAQGNLLVTPRRIVFDGKKKMQELNLANIGKDTARYVITFMDIRMKEDGSFEQITEPDSGQYFAGKYLRVFPRSVILAPNEAQVVKIQVAKSEKLDSGEYRSHVYFRAISSKNPFDEDANDSTGIAIRLTAVFGISIPVIIQVGTSDTKVRFSDVSFKKADHHKPKLKMAFNRNGNMSVYGDVTVNYISLQGKTTQVALVKGIAVYTPNTVRRFEIELNDTNIDYHSGKLLITYRTQKETGAKVLAEREVELLDIIALDQSRPR